MQGVSDRDLYARPRINYVFTVHKTYTHRVRVCQ